MAVQSIENAATTAEQVGGRDALKEEKVSFTLVADAMPQMVWSTLPDGFHDYYNRQWYDFTGAPHGSTDGEAWNGMFHPEDQDRAWQRWRRSLETGEPYEVEYRLRHRSGDYRWTIGRALPLRAADGRITRWIGTCTDIHEAKQAAAHNEILSRELSHRIKNIFAVISGLIGLSARRDPAVKTYARELQQRVGALGRAHEFVRPHSEQSMPLIGPSTLHHMLADLLSAYPARAEGRLVIEGDDVAIDDRGATPVALVVHELATNAAKYGALSAADGEVLIRTARRDEELHILWSESNGPPVTNVPLNEGFGTKLAEMSITQQLGGTIERDWKPDGLQVRIVVRPSRLVRS